MFPIFKILRLLKGFFILSTQKDLIPREIIQSFPKIIEKILNFIINRNDSNLSESLQKLGPTWIKMGQFLSTRPDVIGKELSDQLRELQDNLPAFDKKYVEEFLTLSFGKDYKKIFTEINEPVAAASIAQVHKAQINIEGKKKYVALKILRPNILNRIKKDLEDFYFAANFLEKISSEARRLRAVEIVKTLEESLFMEVDLRLEGAAQSEIIENTENDDFIEVPKIYWELTTKNILTTEWVDAYSSKDIQKLKKTKINFEDIAENIMKTFLVLAIRDGFFHADMHQGNLFIREDSKVIPVDFGIMGRLSIDSRRYLLEILSGFINKDYKKIADIHFEAGYVPKNQDRDKFAQALRSIGEPIMGQDSDKISMGHLLSQLFEITNQFEMKTQPQLLLLQKTMVVTEGVAREFNPKLNIWTLSEPILKDLENIKLLTFSKLPFDKIINSPNPKEIYLSIINEIEKTKKDFKKIKDAFGKDGLKIDENSIMLIKKDKNAKIFSSKNVLIIIAVIFTILLINIYILRTLINPNAYCNSFLIAFEIKEYS